MKTYFEKPEIGVISFTVEDMITVSSETEPELDEDELPVVPMPDAN